MPAATGSQFAAQRYQRLSPCEHAFVTSQGSAHGRFTRAITSRNLFAAEIAARELGGLALDDALDLVVLIAEQKPERLEAAALRWHGRLELEASVLTIKESQLALSALADLPSGGEEVRALLRRLLRRVKPTLPAPDVVAIPEGTVPVRVSPP